MDSGLGKMLPLSETKAEELKEKNVPIFCLGEILEIKDSLFAVDNITSSHVSLKILPDNTTEEDKEKIQQEIEDKIHTIKTHKNY